MKGVSHVKIEKLPDSELSVMLVLWSQPEPVKTSAILEMLNEDKDWTMSTLQTILSRLYNRGFVDVKTEKRLHFYSPKISEDAYREQETKSFLQKFYGNSCSRLFAALADSHRLNNDDIKEIEAIIENAREG